MTMTKCVECGRSDIRLIRSRSDGQTRCQKDYNIFNYGFCSQRHYTQTVANGRDGLCESHRNGKAKKILAIGDTNEYGVTVVSGPHKERNRWDWTYRCPVCLENFVAPTANFERSKSCYSCRGILLRRSSEDRTWKQLWLLLKARKHAKNLGCDIDLKSFISISQKPCHYCGSEPTPSKGHRKWAAYVNTNGLDRVDNSKGYLLHNVVPCCIRCNSAKRDESVEDFLLWAKRLAEHQNM